ncbi:MAG: rod shape-determining protein RodA [Paludibacteraceae bacterium]|nr:rod shape-determining protein RodA [Paludibacteraceae bacterium]
MGTYSVNTRNSIWKGVDWITVGIYMAIALFGWVNIYGACYNFEQTSIFSFSNNAGKQLVWIATALVMGLVVLMIDEKLYDVLGYWLYGLMVVLLIITPLLAYDTKGSLSWIAFGPIKLQPAEFAKFITAIAVAKSMSGYGYAVRSWRDLVKPFLLIGIPMVLIMVWQKETGSALVFAAFLLVFYTQGMSGKLLLYGVIAILLGVAVLKLQIIPHEWLEKVLQPHQLARIEVVLGIREDPMGVGYNVAQSLIAIGSGRFLGKGFLQGTQTKLSFVPEQHTDFIFCTVGEEWGFVGCFILIALYVALILRIIYIALRQRDVFSQVYAYSVASILFLHFTINIGMVLGLLPVIGIPLPFFSYGGSSFWGFTLLLFILLRLDGSRINKLH